MPAHLGEVQIRNRRYRPWVEIVGVMWLVLLLFLTMFWQGVAGSHRLRAYPLVACLLLGAGYCLRMWMLVLDLTERPLLSRRETARAVWNWLFHRVRPDNPRRVRVRIALTLFGWLAPRRISVAALKLGDTVEFDSRVPVPVRSVTRVVFTPDPAEDYAESEVPVHLCQAFIELESEKRFELLLDETDAARLRDWALAKGITICDCDGYAPRKFETTSEA